MRGFLFERDDRPAALSSSTGVCDHLRGEESLERRRISRVAMRRLGPVAVIGVGLMLAFGGSVAQAGWNLTGTWKGVGRRARDLRDQPDRERGQVVRPRRRRQVVGERLQGHDQQPGRHCRHVPGPSWLRRLPARQRHRPHRRCLPSQLRLRVGRLGYAELDEGELPGRSLPGSAPWPRLPDALVPLVSVSNGCGGGPAGTSSNTAMTPNP